MFKFIRATAAVLSLTATVTAAVTASAHERDEGHEDAVTVEMTYLATYTGSGAGNGLTGTEIVAFDARTKRAFAVNTGTNTVDVIDMSNAAPRRSCSAFWTSAPMVGESTASP